MPADDSDASESESNSDEGGDGARGDPLSEDGGGDHAAESDGEGESDGGDSDGDDDEEDEEEDDDSDDEEEMGAERRASHGAAGTAGQGRQAARDKKGGFFARTPDGTKFTAKSFADLGLSRPLVKVSFGVTRWATGCICQDSSKDKWHLEESRARMRPMRSVLCPAGVCSPGLHVPHAHPSGVHPPGHVRP